YATPPSNVSTVPDAPTGVSASSIANNESLVTWVDPVNSPPTNGGATITGYTVQYSADGGTTWTTATTSATGTNYTVTGLTNGTTYEFEVAATNASGMSAYATPPSNVSTVPDAPTGVSASSIANNESLVTWGAPVNDGGATITSYTVRYSADGGANWTTATTSATGPTYLVTGLTNRTTYEFDVAATNDTGTGAYATSSLPGTQVPVVLTSLSGTFGSTLVLTSSGGSGSGAVTYSVPSSGSAGCSLDVSGALIFSGVGSCLVTVTKAASSSFTQASVTSSVSVNPATQVIALSKTSSTNLSDPNSYNVTAFSNDTDPGASLIYSVDTIDSTASNCTVTSAGVVNATSTGQCVIVVGALATTNFAAAIVASQTVTIFSGVSTPPPIVLTSTPPTLPTVGSTYSVRASEVGGLVAFTLDALSVGCSLNGQLVTFTSTGTCIIVASSNIGALSVRQVIAVRSAVLGSPLNVTAAPDDGEAIVTWSAPTSAAFFSTLTYTVTASSSSTSCVTTSLSCLVTGLINNSPVTFSVVASAQASGQNSSSSLPSAPVTPREVSLTPTSTPGTTEVAPGQAIVIASNGTTVPATVTLVGNTVTIASGTVSMGVVAGSLVGQGANTKVTIMTGAPVTFSGAGFLPGSTVDFYLFSGGVILGSVLVNASGSYSVTLTLPMSLAAGNHTLQSQGFAASGFLSAVSLGVSVSKVPALTLRPFGSTTTTLTSAMRRQLETLAQQIRSSGATSVIIAGYTDNVGTQVTNERLSRERALNVEVLLRQYLKNLRVTGAITMTVQGLGSQHYVAWNGTSSGRSANRRVVVTTRLLTLAVPV
ncbi:MAG TPA: fibronectin type III domain-containing protein, partial [Acidimicrobiales bacterium]